MEILLILLLIVVGIPLLLVFITWWMWRSKQRIIRRLAFVPIALLIGLVLEVYWAFYPREEFYRAEWVENTGFILPDDIDFIAKSATYPDIHGDYSASAVMEVKAADLANIEMRLQQSSIFEVDTSQQRLGITTDFTDLLRSAIEIQPDVVYRSTRAEWFHVGLIKAHSIFVFERSSS
ncbi:MAG: hypothetical protein JST38_12270 [Bacteroidetes bacterium]|nr:hypothetical protein [Bacteroidota bacterium]MBS1941640.1 hypothetical protein [Bacteroidota bacterium]